MTVVLDTNVVLCQLGDALMEPSPEGPYAVSVISEMELLSYPSLTLSSFRQRSALLGSSSDALIA
jgi:hypothetical protein